MWISRYPQDTGRQRDFVLLLTGELSGIKDLPLGAAV